MKQNWILPKTALVVHNALAEPDEAPYPQAPLTDNDTVSTAKEICRILVNHGVKAELFPLAHIKDLLKLKVSATDFVFNCLDDDIGTTADSYHLVPRICHDKGVAYSGETSAKILLTANKAATKKLCLDHLIKTPDFWLVAKLSQVKRLPLKRAGFFPVMVKPVSVDASEGITQKSVVSDALHLEKQVKKIARIFKQPALVESYIPGREISQSFLRVRNRWQLFPPAEIIFTKGYKPAYKIVDFKAKWRKGTNEFEHTRRRLPAKLSPKLKQQLKQIVLKVIHSFKLTSYARLDFRLDGQDRFWLIDINVNPDISNDQDTAYPAAAAAAGYSYEDLILQITDTTLFKHSQ